ncbi:MAG: type II toxin-antitoxin system HicB family antitoxin [Armatimonadetes bacterium]|nr:type II toxin-antitoxin system HicB family antitoxin [Armatimonadota bacterium]
MTFSVRLKESDQGWAVWVPALPGCASQGATREQALDAIKAAIREYLSVVAELHGEDGSVEETVTVDDKVA